MCLLAIRRLLDARSGKIQPIPPPPAPPPKGAAKSGFEYGAETVQGSDDSSLEDAFKAAGWTGEEAKDPNNVDTARSPGINRNFGDVPQSDFKKPYSGPGGAGRKGRYG